MDKLECQICHKEFKNLPAHLGRKDHPSWNEYKEKFPSARSTTYLEKFIEEGKKTRFSEDQEPWNKGRTERVKCFTCGSEFEEVLSRIKRNEHHFCSKECFDESRQELMRGERNPFYGKNHSEDTKEEISKSIQRGYDEGREPWNEGLTVKDDKRLRAWNEGVPRSEEVKDKLRRPRPHMRGSNHPNWTAKEETECAECGKTMLLTPHRMSASNKHFCDYDCMGKWFSKNRKGENHPNWKGESFQRSYPPEFYEIRDEIRERDDYICQYCGLPEEEHFRELDIHHIDGDKNNNSKENLVALCHRCNILVERFPVRFQFEVAA